MPSNLRISSAPAGRALPDALRRALETLSGYDLSDVRVHADSVLPAQVGARAFAHGRDIYLARGAEQVLAHEAWHVVQQKQGRVRATRELGSAAAGLGGAGLNDDRELEAEAEVMGRLALQLSLAGAELPCREGLRFAPVAQPFVQRHVEVGDEAYGDLKELREDISKAQGLTDGDVIGFLQILTDILDEDLFFDSWASLAREIRIREVGYQAESAMRNLMNEHRRRLAGAESELEEYVQAERRRYLNELHDPIGQRTYENEAAMKDAIHERKMGIYKARNVLRWGNPVTFSGAADLVKDYPVYQWLTGTIDTPLLMNCWEAVIYSLIQTGLVTKDYMTACVRTRKEALPELRLDVAMQLVQWIARNRDYCFVSPDCDHKVSAEMFNGRVLPAEDEKELAPDKSIFIPGRLVIPRGRIVLFGDTYDHCAISTGKRVLIKTQKASERFGTVWGHGMLELDGNSRTIQERSIEDLYECKPNYLRRVVTVAPFPIISNQGFVELRTSSGDKKGKLTPADMKKMKKDMRDSARREVLREQEEAAARKKAELDPHLYRKAALLKEQREKQNNNALAHESSAIEEELETLNQTIEQLNAKWAQEEAKIEQKLRDASDKANKEYNEWSAQNSVVSEKQRLSYSAHDPYKGRVEFKYKVG